MKIFFVRKSGSLVHGLRIRIWFRFFSTSRFGWPKETGSDHQRQHAATTCWIGDNMLRSKPSTRSSRGVGSKRQQGSKKKERKPPPSTCTGPVEGDSGACWIKKYIISWRLRPVLRVRIRFQSFWVTRIRIRKNAGSGPFIHKRALVILIISLYKIV